MEPIEIDEYARVLFYKRGYTADFVRDTLERERLNGLRVLGLLSDDMPSDLEFLRDFSFLTRLELSAVPPADFEYGFLSELGALEHLVINVSLLPRVKANPLNLQHLSRLKYLALTWRDDVHGLAELRALETLCLVQFPFEDLRRIPAEISLRHLLLKTASIRSLTGIETQRGLETVSLAACARLRDLSGIAALQQLRGLTLARCPKLTDLAPLAALAGLRQLGLEDCPRLASIRPLANLRLDRLDLSGTTNILDGDTTPASGVGELFYHHREHYNHRLPTPTMDALVAENRSKILGLG